MDKRPIQDGEGHARNRRDAIRRLGRGDTGTDLDTVLRKGEETPSAKRERQLRRQRGGRVRNFISGNREGLTRDTF